MRAPDFECSFSGRGNTVTTLNFHILVTIWHGVENLSGEISIFVALVGGRHYFYSRFSDKKGSRPAGWGWEKQSPMRDRVGCC